MLTGFAFAVDFLVRVTFVVVFLGEVSIVSLVDVVFVLVLLITAYRITHY